MERGEANIVVSVLGYNRRMIIYKKIAMYMIELLELRVYLVKATKVKSFSHSGLK